MDQMPNSIEKFSQSRNLFIAIGCGAAIILILVASIINVYLSDRTFLKTEQGDFTEVGINVFGLRALESITMNVGFGIVAAIVIFIFVDAAIKKQQMLDWNKERNQIKNDVIYSILGYHLPEQFVDHLFAEALHRNVIRNFMDINYHIREFRSYEIPDDHFRNKFVRLEVSSSFVLQNYSKAPCNHEIIMTSPMRGDLPLGSVPLDAILNIGGERFDLNETQFEEVNYDRSYRIFSKHVLIPPGGRITVNSTFVLVKERSDNEIWTSLVPSLAARLSVVLDIPDLVVGSRALSSSPLIPSAVNPPHGIGRYVWSQTDPLLAHQGMVLWWREA